MTKFIYSLVIGISLLFIPTPASAEDIIINLNATTPYVDVIIQVDTTTAYTITTTTGPRTEVVDSQTVERVAWVDSWLWLYRGVADSTTANPIRGDDDSNHSINNYFASAISGTLNADTYTIRATSYDYVVAGQRPIGTYTLSSNLIPPRIDTPTVVVDTPTVVVDTSTVVIDTNTSTVDGTTATVDTSTAVVPTPAPEPPVVAPEPPPVIYVPPLVEPEPPVTVEEPLIEPIEPPVEVEEPPIEAEEPPDIEEEAPVEEPPIEEELPTEEEELPAEEEPELVQVDEVELETLAPETPVELSNGVVVTAETAIAIQLLQDPVALLQEIFTNPVAALAALGSVGEDMTEEVREESEKVIIAAVIAGNIATQAAATAGAIATYRRKP